MNTINHVCFGIAWCSIFLLMGVEFGMLTYTIYRTLKVIF